MATVLRDTVTKESTAGVGVEMSGRVDDAAWRVVVAELDDNSLLRPIGIGVILDDHDDLGVDIDDAREEKIFTELDLGWLREMNTQLWGNGGATPGHALWAQERNLRKLSSFEWDRLRSLIRTYDLPVVLTGMEVGGLVLVVYGPEQGWIYPGVEAETRPEVLTVVSQRHLSDITNSSSFNETWKHFEAITHTKKNKDLLRKCRLPPCLPKSSFLY